MTRRLDAALVGIATSFRGMSAHPQESNCECHWGSAEELALLKTPDVALDDDLLRRTYWTNDWHHPGPLLRRILPQVTHGLVTGQVEPVDQLGCHFGHSRWQEWPTAQRDAVQEFLDAWWLHVLIDPTAKAPAHEALVLVSEASATLTPWLTTWASVLTDPIAGHQLVVATSEWMYDLLGDAHPWSSWHDEDDWSVALSRWVLRHAPAALRQFGGPSRLHDDVRRLALPFADRWDR
ncbi:hypothetical protein [Micromonospora sp. B9E7]|uniref:hypothetical protein n=1 Tax=Micromonospora sp. B9E7 TaxID=3153574 RepID=UPI00325DF64A